MVAITCTIIICTTVLLCTIRICALFTEPEPVAQQGITEEDLDKAYKEADKDKIPDFQDVIAFINKEFTGVEGDDEE